MNRALRLTLLALALVVVLFAVTWTSIPSSTSDRTVPASASWFMRGLGGPKYGCLRYEFGRCQRSGDIVVGTIAGDDADDLRNRVFIIFGAAAVAVLLVGLAFGAGRRPDSAA